MSHFPKRSLSLFRRKGSILIVSIWILVFFSILSVALFKIASTQINVVKAIEDRAISQYLAKAAYTYAALERKKDKSSYDALYSLRAKREKELGRGKFILALIDEESKININTAPVEILAALPGFSEELAKAITESALRPFDLKEELLLVNGFTEAIFNNSKNFLTVYSEGKVNINTAPTEVLRALGISYSGIAVIDAFRIGRDNKELTEDDGIFKTTAEITSRLEAFGGLSLQDAAQINQRISQNLITVKSSNFTLEVQAQVASRSAMKYAIVMDKDKIKEWREY